MIYLDNAATSFPKPEAVYQKMDSFMRSGAGNAGRAGHRLALSAQQVIDEGRRQVAALFNLPDPNRVVFTLNATDAINIALKGILRSGDHVIASSMEHNAVARPLAKLTEAGVQVTWAPGGATGRLEPAEVAAAIKPQTRLIVVAHASNVSGVLQPVAALAELARAHDLLLMLDAAQTAGCVPLDVADLGVDIVAFPGHKGLFGPPGTGGLYVGPRAEVTSLREGGTGSASESTDHPSEYPARLEAGTHNSVGIAGLGAGVQFVRETGVATIQAHEAHLTAMLWQGLARLPQVRLYGPPPGDGRVGVVSFTLEAYDPPTTAAILDSSFGIAVRAGLHCAPLAHRTMGTFPAGTVRMACGFFNTEPEIQRAVAAVAEIAAC